VNFDTTQTGTEVDGDHEVAEMKIRYDAKLKSEEETAHQLMHLHAVMTKAHDTLIKDSNQQKVEIKRLRDKEARLYETIHSLEKDIQSHKKEIREREETITDKEKRIFELKKKNQVSNGLESSQLWLYARYLAPWVKFMFAGNFPHLRVTLSAHGAACSSANE
jgi:septal ring factor EnvC (AmiA/AmiB activator)